MRSTPTSPLYQTCKQGSIDWTEDENHPNRTGILIQRLELTLEGESPKYEGWTFLATLASNGDKNLLLLVPGHDVDLSRYVEQVGICEHCNKVRNRKETFVVQHDSGELKAVGRSCIKDFLGHQSPEQIANYAAALCCLEGELSDNTDLEDSEKWGAGGAAHVDLHRWLCVSAAFTRIDGFIPRARADAQGIASTNIQMMNWMFGRSILPVWKERYTPTDEDKETATRTLEWMKAIPPSANSFFTNLKTLAETGCVGTKGYGIATSAVAVCLTQRAEQQKQIDSPLSNSYIGEVNGKIQEEVTVIRKYVFDSSFGYGTSCVHVMLNDNNQTIVWFAPNSAEWLELNCRYKITATVKKHDMFKSTKQTTVNRLKVIDKIGKLLTPTTNPTHTPAGELCAF